MTTEELIKVVQFLGKQENRIEWVKAILKENEQLKQQISGLENDLRVAKKDREELKESIANGLKEFVKDNPYTSLQFLADKKIKEENDKLKQQIEEMTAKYACLLDEYDSLEDKYLEMKGVN
jgi:cell division protein FtsB